jgi:hypothetical protein
VSSNGKKKNKQKNQQQGMKDSEAANGASSEATEPWHGELALHVADEAQLPLPTSPAYLCEWELGLLGLPVEEQGCFHIGCTNSLPPSAAQALDHMLKAAGSSTAAASAASSKGGSSSSGGGSSCTEGGAAAVAAPAKMLHLCSGCKAVRYCGSDCQTAAWKRVHKHTCKLYKMGPVLEEMQAAAKQEEPGNEAEQALSRFELGQ